MSEDEQLAQDTPCLAGYRSMRVTPGVIDREILAVICSSVLALWGVLVWRVAWTGEMPRRLRGEGRLRSRLRLGLAAAPPTGRVAPLLIVETWVLSLMFLSFLVSERLDGGIAKVMKAIGVVLLTAFVTLSLLIVVVRRLNWPKFVIPLVADSNVERTCKPPFTAGHHPRPYPPCRRAMVTPIATPRRALTSRRGTTSVGDSSSRPAAWPASRSTIGDIAAAVATVRRRAAQLGVDARHLSVASFSGGVEAGLTTALRDGPVRCRVGVAFARAQLGVR
jgi:hypothetical protein